MEEKYIVALEIGSSKIKGAIGTVDSAGALSVKAVEEEKLADVVRYGCIRNVVETANAIRTVIGRLEQREPGRTVTGVYVSVGGRSMMAQSIEIERRLPSEMEITNDLISDIINDALAYQLSERSIVGVTQREFRVDNSPTNRPVGTFGSHVSARLNLISCRTQLVRNLNHVLDERLHIAINDVFVRQVAEADLVLFPEERRQGCMLVDFGAETTTVSIYKNDVMLYLSTIPMGSRNITRDTTALNYLEEMAEDLKIDGGNALSTPEPVPTYSGKGFDFGQINNYVSARAGEIIANINEHIKYAGLTPDRLPAGIILIGRGSKLNGFDRRLENLTTLKVRFGTPGNRIRILDGRVNSTEHVDVISILAEAVKSREIQECMTLPRTVAPAPEEFSYSQAHQQQPAPQTGYQQPLYRQPQQQPYQQAPAQQPYQPAAQQVQQPTQQPYQQPVNPYAHQAQSITNATVQSQQAPQQQPYNPPAAPEKKSGFAKLLGSVRDRVVALMTEPVEDDDVENDE